MAAPTNTFNTYAMIGEREDLTDQIYDISPTDTPFMNSVGRTKATNVFHEWQTDSLATANSSNAHIEGDDFSGDAATATTRVGNYCQIFKKQPVVADTARAVVTAGRDDEMDYQVAKRAKELKRDIEKACLDNRGYNSGGSTTARIMRGLPSWLTTNVSRGSSGSPSSSPDTAAVDGVTRAITEAILKVVVRSCWDNGATPTMVMCGSAQKQIISQFAGRTSARQMTEIDRIQGAAHLYASDFGELRVVPNRFQRQRDVFVLDPEYACLAFLRPIESIAIAKSGDSTKRLLVTELTMEVKNEAAHGVAADISSSS